MNKLEIEIFDRTHRYEYNFNIENDINVLKKLKQKIQEPLILSYCGLESINIYIEHDDYSIANSCIKWIYKQKSEGLNAEHDIRECLLKCATENADWTKWRNRDYNGIYYRKITFFPEIQDMVCSKIDEYLKNLSKAQKDFIQEEQKKEEEKNKQKNEWEITKKYRSIYPTGGENDKDGYIDAEYTSKTGNTIRMVSRDIFDFGCYSYPKRLEGTENIFNKESWTEPEKQLGIWLNHFGEFTRIRM